MTLVRRVYKIKSNKIKKSVKLFGITDMHFTKYTRCKKLNDILDAVKKEKCDYVVFTGDLIDHTKRIDTESLKKLHNFFVKLCINNKIIFIKGNHDTKDNSKMFYDLTDFFESLSSLENFYYLDGIKNRMVSFEEVDFYGFEFDNEFYYELKEENEDLIVKRANLILEDIKSDKYNVLLFHSPILLLKESVRKKINNIDKVDLILCGHMHNGLIPDYFDKRSKNKGIISPRKKLFPSFSRNNLVFKSTIAIIMYPLSYYYKIEKFGYEFLFRPGYQVITISK